jgi:cell pole-organizing protein PopZ
MAHYTLESDGPDTEDVLASIRRAIEADFTAPSGRASGFAGILGGRDGARSAPDGGFPPRETRPLISREAELRTRAAFNRLNEGATRQAFGGQPIGDAARDYLRSAIKQWLDDNLPALAERLVREEIERVVRGDQRR